jgi:hypothetical protein
VAFRCGDTQHAQHAQHDLKKVPFFQVLRGTPHVPLLAGGVLALLSRGDMPSLDERTSPGSAASAADVARDTGADAGTASGLHCTAAAEATIGAGAGAIVAVAVAGDDVDVGVDVDVVVDAGVDAEVVVEPQATTAGSHNGLGVRVAKRCLRGSLSPPPALTSALMGVELDTVAAPAAPPAPSSPATR